MAEVAKKKFKSKYHILIWIAVLSLAFMGMLEYGYLGAGKGAWFWKLHLGLVPYVSWLVLTYIATRPKWFIEQTITTLTMPIIRQRCTKCIALWALLAL